MDIHFRDGFGIFDAEVVEYINDRDRCAIAFYIHDPKLNLIELKKHLTEDNLQSFIVMTRDGKYQKTEEGYVILADVSRRFDEAGEHIHVSLFQK